MFVMWYCVLLCLFRSVRCRCVLFCLLLLLLGVRAELSCFVIAMRCSICLLLFVVFVCCACCVCLF